MFVVKALVRLDTNSPGEITSNSIPGRKTPALEAPDSLIADVTHPPHLSNSFLLCTGSRHP